MMNEKQQLKGEVHANGRQKDVLQLPSSLQGALLTCSLSITTLVGPQAYGD